MKNLSGLFLVMFLLVGTLGFVVADEHDAVPELISAVTLADAPEPRVVNAVPEAFDGVPEAVTYDDVANGDVAEARKVGAFENFRDRIGLAFTFDKERKIERILFMAEKRLAEAELLAEENPEGYAQAQEKYDELVARAENILANIESRAEDVNMSAEDIGKVARIQDKFERHRSHSDEIYTRALERFEMNNASSEKIERFEMFYERALNRSYKMEAKIIEKQKKNIEKYRNLSEASDDEIKEVILEIEENEGLNGSREERKLKAENRIDRVVDAKNKHITRMRFELKSSDLTAEERTKIEIKIRDSTLGVDDFEVRFREKLETQDGKFEIKIHEKVRDGDIETEVRVRDDAAKDALRAVEDAAKDALRAVEDAAKDALRAEEDAAKDAY